MIENYIERKQHSPLQFRNKQFKRKFKEILKSNLNFKEKEVLDSRHLWHAFPAKFPPQLPKIFIENLTEENQVVLDPMMGSCTTLIEAALLKRKACGFDIDPLSLALGRAKTQNINLNLAEKIGNNIAANAKLKINFNLETLRSDLINRFDEENKRFLDFWFSKNIQCELLALIQEIEKVKNEEIKNFFKLVFSSVIITKSGGVTLARDLAHTRPHKVSSKKINSALDEFTKKYRKILQSCFQSFSVNPEIKEANAKRMPIESSSIDLIVTSPPYANNAIDYMRAHKFSLIWFGYSVNDLTVKRKNYIGSESRHVEELAKLPNYTRKIVTQLSHVNKRKGEALYRYYSEMTKVISEMYRVLRPERAAVVVVATSVLNGINVETNKCIGEIAKYVGFELVHMGARSIDRDKRMMPARFKGNSSQIETRMHDEFIVGLWKGK